jgi:hypothetical protein
MTHLFPCFLRLTRRAYFSAALGSSTLAMLLSLIVVLNRLKNSTASLFATDVTRREPIRELAADLCFGDVGEHRAAFVRVRERDRDRRGHFAEAVDAASPQPSIM